MIAATGGTIFSLVAVFTATIAWFNLNQAVKGTGMAIKATTSGPAFSSVAIHLLDSDPNYKSTEQVLKFDPTPARVVGPNGQIIEDNTEGNISILDYADLHKTDPVLLLFSLTVSVSFSDLNLHATLNAKASNDPDPYPNNQVTATNRDSFPLSHVVHFVSCTYNGTDGFPYHNVVIDSSYTPPTSEGAYVTTSNDVSFVSVSSDPANMETPLSIPYNTITIFEGTGSGSARYLGVVMDYYVPAIEALMTANLGNANIASSEGGRTPNRIGFSCDWVMEL